MIIKKPNFWNTINLISLFLLPLSLLTLVIYYIKKKFITGYKFNIPIICVGNIYIGGTGKTPLSIFIYNLLKKKKFKPAIVRKYYKSHLDEIDLIKDKSNKVYLSKKRVLSILRAKKKNNVIIMDDGFQDYSIKKKLNIVCFSTKDLIGNGLLLPAGPLREPLDSLNKAQIVVINGRRNNAFEKRLKKISNKIKIFYSSYKIKKISISKNKRLLAFAGIGNPESFFDLLKKNKFKIGEKISFPDHYNYNKNEIQNIINKAKKKNLKVITTEKDFFRLKNLGINKVEYVSIDLKISNYRNFEKEIIKNL
tara:strand:- start:1353 stop:2276 length:924 start_codon:yes stop_codon:yes gene_type:complete